MYITIIVSCFQHQTDEDNGYMLGKKWSNFFLFCNFFFHFSNIYQKHKRETKEKKQGKKTENSHKWINYEPEKALINRWCLFIASWWQFFFFLIRGLDQFVIVGLCELQYLVVVILQGTFLVKWHFNFVTVFEIASRGFRNQTLNFEFAFLLSQVSLPSVLKLKFPEILPNLPHKSFKNLLVSVSFQIIFFLWHEKCSQHCLWQ